MSALRYPNESNEYRHAHDLLLKDEQQLVDKLKSVVEKRRKLPLGGQLKEDYIFQWANDGEVGKPVKFSELFADKNTLLLYSFMFGPNWDHPSPSCTSLVDGFDRAWYSVTQDVAFVAIARRFFTSGERKRCQIMLTRCGRIGILWTIRQRVDRTALHLHKIFGQNFWKNTT